MAPPRRSVLIARQLAEDPDAGLSDLHESPHILRHLCGMADEKTTCGDRDGLRVARLCCRIAGRLKTDEALASSFARLGTALRAANRLDHAGQALRIGLELAPPHLEGDLLRRRAWVRIWEKRYAEALADAEAALERTHGAEHAKSLEALGVAHYYRGDNRTAIEVLGRCLAAVDPDSGTFYCNAIHNYAAALAEGTDEEAARAVELCAELRPLLKYRHKRQRAKLWWMEGLLQHRLGDSRTAWRSLNHARRALVAMEAAAELAGLVADMARVSPEPIAVRLICDEASEVIVHGPLRRRLESLATAAREMIPQAAAALRDAASRRAPCPAI